MNSYEFVQNVYSQGRELAMEFGRWELRQGSCDSMLGLMANVGTKKFHSNENFTVMRISQ